MTDAPQYGGQALIEGVMIRGPRHLCVACREGLPGQQGPPSPDGPIFVQSERVETFASRLVRRFRVARWPLIRGSLVLLESIELGAKGLRLSAAVALGGTRAAPAPSAPAPARRLGPPAGILVVGGALAYGACRLGWLTPQGLRPALIGVLVAGLLAWVVGGVQAEESLSGAGPFGSMTVAFTMALGLTFGIGIFFLLPSWLAGELGHRVRSPWVFNVVEGAIRIAFFFAYLALISRMANIRRIFQYHGAEHQVIHVQENGLPLVPENAARFPTIHPRCGTAFLAIVLVVSVVVFAFCGWQSLWIRLPLRVVLLPIVAGISYELLKWNSRRPNLVLRALVAPGLWFQRITTLPPSRDQVEVAIAAMNGVLGSEEHDRPAPAITAVT